MPIVAALRAYEREHPILDGSVIGYNNIALF